MPRDFTSIHICAKLCVSRYLQTDKPVDGQIETCMQYIYIYRYIYYILANLTTLEHILNLQRGIQLWLVFLSLQIDQSHAFDFTDFTDSRSRHTQKLTRFLPSNVLISVWSVLLMSYRFDFSRSQARQLRERYAAARDFKNRSPRGC